MSFSIRYLSLSYFKINFKLMSLFIPHYEEYENPPIKCYYYKGYKGATMTNTTALLFITLEVNGVTFIK